MKIRFIYLLLILLPFLYNNCTTEKNTSVTRTYHNITSRYNIFFNGSESFKKGEARAEKDFADNYSQILPVFFYSDKSTPGIVASDMNRTIQKAAKVITLHSITAKPEFKRGIQNQRQKDFYNKKEYTRWIDNNLLLMGKSYVYKHDFYLALETFRQIVTDFPNEPTRYEALIWMARTYQELNEFRDSERILLLLETDEDIPKSLIGDFNITFADLFIKQKNYNKAIPYLEKALKFTRRKARRTRYTYILAQLYEETNQMEKAGKKYRDVIKMNPPYEMTFNARINLAGTFTAGANNAKEINTQLRKMLKDEKNQDFLDQIFYALGDLELKQGNEIQAIEYFSLSARKSTTNMNQKGLSYLTLGDIYYCGRNYPLAQAYYDSCLQNISPDYDKYEELSNITISLTGLVENLRIYELEDSLQRLALLPENERIKIVDEIIADLIAREEEERKKMQDEQLDAQFGTMMSYQGSTRPVTGDEAGKWYFYNLNAKSFGQPEFRMKWGNRRLEDNWRRKNKQTVEVFEMAEQIEMENDSVVQTPTAIINTKSREYYLRNIPLTDSMKNTSHGKLSEALYNLGLIYRNDFNDLQKSTNSFEELLRRYPKTQFAISSYYNLYEIYEKLQQFANSEKYKNLLIGEFPESPPARILSDPNYLKQLEDERKREYSFYDETFNALNRSEFDRVIQNAEIAISTFEHEELFPRFSLLKALATGGLKGKETLKAEMEELSQKYPDHEVGIYAKEMISFIYMEAPEIKIADTQAQAEEIYVFDSEAPHYFAILTDKSTNGNQLNFNIINFNLDNYNNLNLAIQREQIAGATMFVIRSFTGAETAKRYMDAFVSHPETFRDIDKSLLKIFLISGNNFITLLTDRNTEKYLLFYDKYYSGK